LTGFPNWTAADKLRIEATKLEKGTVAEASTTAQCTSPTLFGSMVAPELRGGGNAAPLNCTAANCHGAGGNGQGAMDLSGIQNGGTNFTAACAAVLNKVNKTTPAQSLIIMKPAGATAHTGGKVTNTAAFTTDFTGYISGGTIF
jgi:hypothetical protein